MARGREVRGWEAGAGGDEGGAVDLVDFGVGGDREGEGCLGWGEEEEEEGFEEGCDRERMMMMMHCLSCWT